MPRPPAARRTRMRNRQRPDALRVRGHSTTEHGGFGGAPKFPITAPLELAIEVYRENHDQAMAHLVEVTLDAMGWRGLHDEVDGGFFRCAATARLAGAAQEKTARSQRRRCSGCWSRQPTSFGLRGIRSARPTSFATCRRGWPIQSTAGGPDRSRPTAATTRRPPKRAGQMAAPSVDTRALCRPGTAQMVSAMLRAAELLDDSGLGEFAVKSLERLVFTCYAPGRGHRALSRRGPFGSRPAGRSGCDGLSVARCPRRHRKHRLRDDGAGAGALRGPGDVGRAGWRLLRSVDPRRGRGHRPDARAPQAVCRQLRRRATAEAAVRQRKAITTSAPVPTPRWPPWRRRRRSRGPWRRTTSGRRQVPLTCARVPEFRTPSPEPRTVNLINSQIP